MAESKGKKLQGEDLEARRQAAQVMGQARTKRKREAARENGKKGGRPRGTGKPLNDETKAKQREAQRLRRARERKAREGK